MTSPLEAVYEIKILEGTTVYTGPVGYQGGIYLGGQNNIQTFVQKPWDIDNLEILNKLPLK
ncbi:hypothetical protein [Psychrobacillus sp. FSL K6-1464]|uniref:hypothetical protein n=1 Tax=Psychrobacillus sp. FSL K6-1464 TaxID=2921545 RepID=UPI0030F6E943